jgi:hypothetical protein
VPWFAHRWKSRTCTHRLHLSKSYPRMRITIFISALLAPLAVLAAPVDVPSRSDLLDTRQARPTKPPPCVRAMNTTEAQTATRAEAFAQAFIYKKDVSEAFKYISQDYIVRSLPSLLCLFLPTRSIWWHADVSRTTTPLLKTASTLHGTSCLQSGVRRTLRLCARRSSTRRVG